jgi:hypothetical protein
MNSYKSPRFIYLTMREYGGSTKWRHWATAVRYCGILVYILFHFGVQAQHWGTNPTKCNDTIVLSTVSTAPSYLGYPMIACQPSNVLPMYMDSVYHHPCGDMFLTTITRMWKGLYTPGCTQTIQVKRPILGTIKFPSNFDGNPKPYIDAATQSTQPVFTGFPTLNGINLTTNYGWIVNYSDNIKNFKDGTFAIYRKWVAFDTCTWQVNSDVQVILVEDYQSPSITCPVDITIDCAVSTKDLSKTGKATATDNTGIYDIRYKDVVQGTDCLKGIVTFRQWIAEDNGGNLTICTQKITQKNTTAPTIIKNQGSIGDFTGNVKNKKVSLFPNSPNPFADATTIKFWLKESTNARIEIWTSAGKLVWQQSQQESEGFHNIAITKSIVQNPGLYYYRLVTPIGTDIQKMIVQ